MYRRIYVRVDSVCLKKNKNGEMNVFDRRIKMCFVYTFFRHDGMSSAKLDVLLNYGGAKVEFTL